MSKIQFSPEELNLATNAEWILTKNRVIAKVMSMFGELVTEYRSIVEKEMKFLPEQLSLFSPKISRGEQYQGLPYVVLDYPRIFSREDIFAVRTFFWWGNYFSLTLHLKGQYKSQLQERIIQNKSFFSNNHFLIAVSEDEWIHDVGEENYSQVFSLGNEFKEKVTQYKFVKLTRTWPLEQANQMEELLASEFLKLLKVITS